MQELWVQVCWAALAFLHLMPAAVVVRPRLIATLYAAEPRGDLGILLIPLVLVIDAAWFASSAV